LYWGWEKRFEFLFQLGEQTRFSAHPLWSSGLGKGSHPKWT
jgi:hypothetical protein